MASSEMKFFGTPEIGGCANLIGPSLGTGTSLSCHNRVTIKVSIVKTYKYICALHNNVICSHSASVAYAQNMALSYDDNTLKIERGTRKTYFYIAQWEADGRYKNYAVCGQMHA